MIVRELLVRLGIDFDSTGADEAEKRAKSLRSAFETLGTVLSFGAVFHGLKSMVEQASAVEQTLSKLRMNFGDDAVGEITGWAKAFADETGASEYQLREFAGTFGSMLVPTLKGNRLLAAQMSKSLSELAVDLAAINNEDPEQTLGRLFSGMTGETEAVERLGIGIKQAALQEFAHERGIQKKVTAMTIAEKTELIYQKILKDTKDKQGAAAREASTYAGMTLRLSAAARDAGTAIGEKLLGPARQLVGIMTQGGQAIKAWAQDSDRVTAAMVTLGSVMAAFGVRMLLMNLPLIGFALGLGLIYLAVDDLIHAFSGGKSVIAEFMKELVGDDVWKRISELPSKLGDVMFEMGLTDKQKKDRGIKGTGAIDFVAPLLGHDADKIREAEKTSADYWDPVKRSLRKEHMDPNYDPTNPLFFPLMQAFGKDPRQMLEAERMGVEPMSHVQGGPRIGDTHINLYGPTTPAAVDDIDERVRRRHEELMQGLGYTANTTPVR